MDLAVVDLEAPMAEQAAVMANACQNIGFFQVPLETVPPAVSQPAWDTAQRFFALPTSQKRQIEFPEAGYPYGYSPYRFETLAKSLEDGTPSGPDLKESLSVGPDCAPATTAVRALGDEAWIRSPSLWPEAVPELRQAWTNYYRALSTLAEQLMQVMAVALDLMPDYFGPLIDRPITSMRALHYPAIEPHVDPGTSLRAGAHSDYGTLTILRTDDVAGLEIQEPDQTWTAITPEPDMFIVNLGDSIAQWTNDTWRSTVHRVVLGDGAPRQSFAFFHMANWDAMIECLPTCTSDTTPSRHEPVQAGPWLMRKFQSTVS